MLHLPVVVRLWAGQNRIGRSLTIGRNRRVRGSVSVALRRGSHREYGRRGVGEHLMTNQAAVAGQREFLAKLLRTILTRQFNALRGCEASRITVRMLLLTSVLANKRNVTVPENLGLA